MKKLRIIAVIMLLILAASVFVACENKNETTDETDVYAIVNALLGKVSYPFTVTTKVTEGEDVFNGTYRVAADGDAVKVDYSYEKLATFGIADGVLVAPDGYKETVAGSVRIKDGKVTEQNGAEVNLSAEAFTVSGISLIKDALTEVKTGEGSFSAKATSLKSLTGIDLNAENVTVNISYTAEKVSTLKVSYSAGDCQTEILYSFD